MLFFCFSGQKYEILFYSVFLLFLFYSFRLFLGCWGVAFVFP